MTWHEYTFHVQRIAFWALLVGPLGLTLLITSSYWRRIRTGRRRREGAVEALRRRYAEGEIDDETYHRMLAGREDAP